MPVISMTGGIPTGKAAFNDCVRELLSDANPSMANKRRGKVIDLNRSSFSKVSVVVVT
jgi:hypothetical protein